MSFRAAALALLLFVAACAQTGQSTQQVVRAEKPPKEYVYLSSGDLRKPKNINVIIDFDAPADGDKHVPVMFGLAFYGAMTDDISAPHASTGIGARAADPIIFPSAAADAEIDAAGAYLAKHFPERRELVGHIYRGPGKRYVMLVSFDTDAGENALYFDVTRWALDLEKPFNN